MVEILKMEFDQDLCENLGYELNPRVCCAFGNVFNMFQGTAPRVPCFQCFEKPTDLLFQGERQHRNIASIYFNIQKTQIYYSVFMY